MPPVLWRQTPLIKDVFHPASYTVDHSLSGVQAHAILRLRTRVLCNLQIAHTRYAISRLRTSVTQSRDCLRNLGILRMCNAISRLRTSVTLSRDSENAQRNLKIAQILRLRRTYTYLPSGEFRCYDPIRYLYLYPFE